jgi:hypothetical protein
MARIGSILWSSCGVACVFCLAPKAVSEPSVPGAGESRQKSIRLRSGTLAASVRWTLDDEMSVDVLRGRIEFHPDAADCSSCSSIRFIQIARTERNGGIDYEWRGMEENRNRLRVDRILRGSQSIRVLAQGAMLALFPRLLGESP